MRHGNISMTDRVPTQVFNKARAALAGNKVGLSRITWYDWVEHESWKRALGGLLITSTHATVLHDVNPTFNASQDLEFEAFHEEALWDAESSTEWREQRAGCVKQQQDGSRRTLKDVFVDVMLEGRYRSRGAPYRVSAFSALVLMSAVVVHMWQRLQVCQAFAGSGNDALLGSGLEQLNRELRDGAMKLLARCDAFLRGAETDMDQSDAD